MPFIKSIMSAFALVGLSACASINPAALAKLAALDPLTADPAQIRSRHGFRRA
jgi:hypothetical protein